MAAQDIGVAYVHVEPSGKGFGKSIEGDIGDAVNKASKKSSSTLISKIGGAFGKIGKVGTGAIATLAGGITALAAKGGFTRALNIENAQAKLKGLGHDSASVTEIMNDALASVKGTAFGLGDAATVAASLSASGIKEGDQLTKVLKTVADTAQISGRSLTDIGMIFGSVAARGKLQGDDMLQLMSSGIPVLQMLGKHLNKTSAEVSDMVSDGKIDFQTFADAMQEGLGGAALSAGTTFTGALANVKAALSRLGETAATPVLDGLRGLFNQAIPLIDTFTAAVTPTLQKVGAALQQGLENAIPATQAKLKNLGDTISNIPGFQMLASATASLKSQLTGLWNAITSLIGGLNNGGEATMFSTTAGALAGVVASVAQVLSNAAGWAKTFVNTFIETGALQPFLDSLTGVISGLGSLVSGLAAAVSQAFGFNDSARTASSAAQSFAGLLNTLTGVLMTVGGWLQSVGQWAQQNGALVSGALKAITIALLAVKGWDIVSAGLKTVSGGLKAISATASGVEKTATATFDLIGKISDAGSAAGALKQLAGSFNIVKAAQSAWSAVTKAATAVQLAFSAALDANPIGMLVVAIGAVVAALTWFFTQTETGKRLWNSFATWFMGIWNQISTACQPILQAIATFITQTMSQIQQIWQTGWTLITTVLQNVWNTIGPIIMTALTAIITGIQTFITTITPLLQAGIQNIQTIFQTAATIISTVWNGLWNTISTVVQGAWTIIATIISTALTVIQGIIQLALAVVNGNWSAAWSAIQGIVSAVWGGIQGVVSAGIGMVSGVVSAACSTIRSVWAALWNGVGSIVSSVWGGIVGTVSNMVGERDRRNRPERGVRRGKLARQRGTQHHPGIDQRHHRNGRLVVFQHHQRVVGLGGQGQERFGHPLAVACVPRRGRRDGRTWHGIGHRRFRACGQPFHGFARLHDEPLRRGLVEDRQAERHGRHRRQCRRRRSAGTHRGRRIAARRPRIDHRPIHADDRGPRLRKEGEKCNRLNTCAPPQVSASASRGRCTARRSRDCEPASGTTASPHVA